MDCRGSTSGKCKLPASDTVYAGTQLHLAAIQVRMCRHLPFNDVNVFIVSLRLLAKERLSGFNVTASRKASPSRP
jgi:hypothetical protein